jgi:lysyl-tRNA synthetase class I
VWNSLRRSGLIYGEPSDGLTRRLELMRSWISSEHFPEEFRLRIQTEIGQEAKENIDERDTEYLKAIFSGLSECPWEPEEINATICNEARNRDIPLRDAFQTLYWIVLNQDYGPKLASVLSEIERETVLNLLEMAI